MKKIIILIIALSPLVSKGQSLWGFTPSEVREKRPGVEWHYNKWGQDKEMLTMAFEQDGMYITYLFNESNKSVFTIATPLTTAKLQGMIELYNKKYVIIDNYNWKYYDSGAVHRCELKQTDDGSYYFLWSVE